MKLLVYLGHPAHFHLFRVVISNLKRAGHDVQIVIKKKDILEDLLARSGWDYRNILEAGRGNSKAAIAWGLVKRTTRLLQLARAFKPDLMVGTSAEIAQVGRVLGIQSVVVNEDDFDVVPLFANVAYPFASALLAPGVCRMGRWERKTIKYEGYHELAYLHPNHFEPDPAIRSALGITDEPYFILRFAQLTAHHDAGIRGIAGPVATDLAKLLSGRGRVFITSERPLEPELERYRIAIDPLKIHHALFFAEMYIGDSQTMAAEAAVLGTPALRFNDFVGRISYLEELEHRYGLTFGIAASMPQKLLAMTRDLLDQPNLRRRWQEKRQRMLAEKIDVADFMTGYFQRFGTLEKRAHVPSGKKTA